MKRKASLSVQYSRFTEYRFPIQRLTYCMSNSKPKYHGTRERAASDGGRQDRRCFSATFGRRTDGLWRPLAMLNLI